ncbi:MetQ/NlpA family ABC transporter substrate-binding protein [Facklamia hominis]|uniref:YaeC family lipoprotein n=1 Tax=Facklamia hominis CCUG 36813 TaxID=883111 RepID=K1LPA7_9LACT|nr:MetQ/NlpA family ABC transporter substrate-binding protein [Facklamia hominis]EKB53962.1 YaeC family lipoprotein [Facklamia hominis CCUG 36813]
MKKIVLLLMASLILLPSTTIKADDNNKIIMGAHTLYKPIADASRDYIESKGYDLDIEYLSDNVQLNEGLRDGLFDVNFHQHENYMNSFNKDRDANLIKVGDGLYRQLIGLFSLNINSIDELKEGDIVAIQNDPTNIDRAMKVLSDAGLIVLDEEKLKSGDLLTDLDIKENPLGLVFKKIEGTALVRTMEDTALGVLTGVHIAEAGFTADEALATYTRDDVAMYDIILSANGDNYNEEKAMVVHDALESDKVKKAVKEAFKGSWVPVSDLKEDE